VINDKQRRLLEQSRGMITELARLFESDEGNGKEQIKQLYYFLTDHLSRGEDIHFSTEFAVLSYIGVKYSLEGQLMFRLHLFRKFLSLDAGQQKDRDQWKSGLFAMALLIDSLLDTIPGPEVVALEVPLSRISEKEGKGMKFIPRERVLFTGRDNDSGWEVLREKLGGKPAFIHKSNGPFAEDLLQLKKLGFSNITLLLREVREDENGVLHPAVIIVEPDFIIDVTAVASCVQPGDNDPSIHLLRKFIPPQNTKYLMAGHVANYFLDRLMENPELPFNDLVRNSFFIDPVSFAAMGDEDIQYIARQALGYYKNIQKLIRSNFLAGGKELSQFSIEPSFYSPGNGIQGRLDLLYRNRKEKKSEIFELKSGSTFRPNAYGINPSHYAQTMLYYLILKDLYPRDENLSAYIIYAKDSRETLRFAPAVRAFQNKTLSLRNKIFIGELQLQHADGLETGSFLRTLGIDKLAEIPGFTGKDARDVIAHWNKLDELEKRYFISFYAFVAREFAHSKTAGGGNPDERKGLSALWLDDHKSKEERFALLSGLRIKEDLSSDANPRMILSRSGSPQKLANFRVGDVVVLYEQGVKSHHAPFTQVYRGTLIQIQKEEITVRLRSRLSQTERPGAANIWALEPDVLESGFRHYFRSLATFMRASKEQRDLWFGRRKPKTPTQTTNREFPGLTSEQNRVMNKMINCRDYFLLWGPPGTGKTSVIIKNLIDHLVTQKGERLLLLAYTNRAVDEICDAILSIGADVFSQTIRIGSRYGTAERYRKLLLERQITELKDRRQLVEFLRSKKIYVSTVSSFYGKWDIRNIVDFDTVIIDEASQILEPYLVGLLSCFKRSILIGDHCQLPAIVTQDSIRCTVKDPGLKKLGLRQLSDSLFERLYLLALENNWSHAVDSLSQQGRMHEEIAEFVSSNFYSAQLRCLEKHIPGADRMQAAIDHYYPAENGGKNSEIIKLLKNRLLFVNTPAGGSLIKTNQYEALAAVELIEQYAALKKIKSDDQIGVICPYKAQIALITQLLEEKMPDLLPLVTVDTVERYQGGARDVILLSLTTNHHSQLHTLVNQNRHGLDRKLNVALTRAREQIVVLGNADILRQNQTYSNLLDRAEWVEPSKSVSNSVTQEPGSKS